jgi:hypothetical protein
MISKSEEEEQKPCELFCSCWKPGVLAILALRGRAPGSFAKAFDHQNLAPNTRTLGLAPAPLCYCASRFSVRNVIRFCDSVLASGE